MHPFLASLTRSGFFGPPSGQKNTSSSGGFDYWSILFENHTLADKLNIPRLNKRAYMNKENINNLNYASLDIRNIKCYDGLDFSFKMLDYHYKGLYELCLDIPNSNSRNLPAVISKSWGCIDTVHRIREVAQAIPGLSKKNEYLRAFLKETYVAEKYRHYIQHLRSELGNKDERKCPIWGSISWVDSTDSRVSYVTSFGAEFNDMKIASCVFDTKEKRFVSKTCLSLDNLSFNFDIVYDATMKFKDFILPWIVENYHVKINFTNKLKIHKIELKSNSHEIGK